MVDRRNLVDFFTRTLEGIGYGKLSKTNRAYNWIKNNHAFEGPCLNFLKKNIAAENLVTVKEMNSFTELQNGGNLPSETEVDEILAGYLTEEPVYFQNMHLPGLHREAAHASKYCETLELEEITLKRQCQRLQDEIQVLESQQEMDSVEEDAIVASATKINAEYNELSKDVHDKLSKVSQSLLAVLHKSIIVEERNLFRMNFDTFRKINDTFRESVHKAIRKQFNKGSKCEDRQRRQVQDISQAKVLISVAQSLGQYEYQHLKLQCEKNELAELDGHIENVLKKSDFNDISCIRLKSLMDTDIESTYQIQKKIMHFTETLEKFHTDYIVKKMLAAYRKQLEHSMKSDCKFLRKVSNISTTFVNLMTLQACLFHKEKENVDTVVAVCDRGRQILDKHTRKHSMAVTNLRRLFEDREFYETSNRSSCFSADSKISNNTLIVPNNCSLLASDNHDPLNTLVDGVLSFIGIYLSNYFTIEEQLHELHKIIFSGPVRQIFFNRDVHNNESLIRQRYDHSSNQYKSWRSQYHKILEKTNVTSFDQQQKMLGLEFLANPTALRHNIDRLRNVIQQNRSKYFRTMTAAPVDSSNFSLLDVKKGNISSAI